MTIYIPKTIRVGYVNRSDTYTGKLAYVIYYGQDGKIRKELSWNNWRDKNIEPDEYENIPTEGFVLNKKVGGHSSGWNHRNSYLRVYHPKGFEFEITPENLVYILENTNSIKGKGLDGEFVFGWDGKDLLLIPTSSPDYQELVSHSKLMRNPQKINSKNIILGGTYRTNKGEDWIYIGRFNYYDYTHNYDYVQRTIKEVNNKGKRYWFYFNDKFYYPKSLSGTIVECVSDVCADNYAEIADRLQYDSRFSPIVKKEPYKFTLEEIAEFLSKGTYGFISQIVVKVFNGTESFIESDKILIPEHIEKRLYQRSLDNFVRDVLWHSKYNKEKICNLLESVYNIYDIWIYCNVLENGKIEYGWIK